LIPAVLVQPGFISNEKDLAILKSRQDEIASQILKGIEQFLVQMEKGLIKTTAASVTNVKHQPTGQTNVTRPKKSLQLI
jgi:hypothetical protein